MKKLISLVLALALMLSMAAVAGAEAAQDLPREETLYFGGQQWDPIVGYNPLGDNMNNGLILSAAPRGSRTTMFETLYMYNALDGKLYPLLADGDYTWNDDLTELTCKIKGAAKWSDGTPVTADDVVATWDVSTKIQNGTYTGYAPYIDSIENKDGAVLIKAKLNEVEDRLEGIKSAEQYSMLMKLLRTDPDAVAEFVTSPVLVKTKELFPYKNNGSAMSPFYIVLSIWVGSLITVAIIHTRVKEGLIDRKFNHVEEFFGRYLVFFFIGQIQTLITVVGALFFVQIQCEHPILLWIAMSLTSFVFTILNYALTFAFGAVGEAAIVVVMVLQVAGSGGTFPVDVLPDFYNLLYKYMPFVYSTNAAKESIAGTYGNYYFENLMILLIYVAVALVIGLLLSIPCKKLILYIKKSTKKTDLIGV